LAFEALFDHSLKFFIRLLGGGVSQDGFNRQQKRGELS